MCVSEHRWLGADALNIGYALLDHDKRSEACEVFSLGMEELFVWVVDGKGVDTQLSRAKEVTLLLCMYLVNVVRYMCFHTCTCRQGSASYIIVHNVVASG